MSSVDTSAPRHNHPDQIAISNSVRSWTTIRGLLQQFDTAEIYSTDGMKILHAGQGFEKTDLLSCNKGLIPVGCRVICHCFSGMRR